MEAEGVGLISVLQRIARALEDMDSILAVLTEETMDMHDVIEAFVTKVEKEGVMTRSV